MKKDEGGPLSYTIHKKPTQKWIKDLNVRPETIKLLDKNRGSKLLDIGLDNDFGNLIPKAKATKAKTHETTPSSKASVQQKKTSTKFEEGSKKM